MSKPLGHVEAPAARNAAVPGRGYLELSASGRSQWIRERRAPRPTFDVRIPHRAFVELERSAAGELLPTLTVLLRSRECPWHCLMCDLWKSTVSHPIPPGAVPAQIDAALTRQATSAYGRVRQIKLYNSGSFFDAGAVPPSDYHAIARCLAGFERVIVECHPKLVNRRALQFRASLFESPPPPERAAIAWRRAAVIPQLEVALGLETVHPAALDRLNKRMTLDDFRRAADFLRAHQIALRVFVLVQPPFVPEDEALEWVERSLNCAFECGATAVSIIPTRLGNGALDDLARTTRFSPPKLQTLESAFDRGLALSRGRVFADLWDIDRFSSCPTCLPARRERLSAMNLQQTVTPPIRCAACGHAAHR
ncbi:MAG: hypothetical protein KJ072_26475 [Verrucomicrobia bacterium]|nr:hypothetical protein [Verrucomicrobiota bacterium]